MKKGRLQEAIRKSGHKQVWIAQHFGVDPNTVWRWGAGISDPSDETKMQLAQLLGVSVSYLMGEGEDAAQNLHAVDSGRRVKTRREAWKLSVEAVAQEAEVSVETLQNWEDGKSIPNEDEQKRIANALSTTAEFLRGETDDPTPPIRKFEPKAAPEPTERMYTQMEAANKLSEAAGVAVNLKADFYSFSRQLPESTIKNLVEVVKATIRASREEGGGPIDLTVDLREEKQKKEN